MRPPAGTTRSAMRSDVKVFPVPHAMTIRPRSWFSRPATTSSTAAACNAQGCRIGRSKTSSDTGSSAWRRKSSRRTVGNMPASCSSAFFVHSQGRHDPAHGEHRTLRDRKKRVDLGLLDSGTRCVALALDSDPAAVLVPRYQVDPQVPPVQARLRLALRPVRPAVHRNDLVLRIVRQHPRNKVLEPAALLRLTPALAPDALQDLADRCGALPQTQPHLTIRIQPAIAGITSASQTRCHDTSFCRLAVGTAPAAARHRKAILGEDPASTSREP